MKRNGFTLIELLAVIVILAIIALIATPIVLNIINGAKTSANERSAELYAKSVENAVMKKQLNGTTVVEAGKYTVQSDGSICKLDGSTCQEGTIISVDVEGDLPTEGYVTIGVKGTITAYKLKISDDTIKYGDVKEGFTLNPNYPTSSEATTLLSIQSGFGSSASDFYIDGRLKYQLVYKDEDNNQIKIYVNSETSLYYASIFLEYNGDKYGIASETVRINNNDIGNPGYGVFDSANVWSIKNGVVTEGYYSACPHYVELTDYPEFIGEWSIDESQSTDLGKQYLQSTLISLE